MTNNSRRPTCIDCKVQLNSSNFTLDRHNGTSNPLCDFCYDRASYENDHQDGGHEDEPDMHNCTMCNPALLKDRSRKGHEGTAPKSQGSHAACYAAKAHEATKAGRAACRKARA